MAAVFFIFIFPCWLVRRTAVSVVVRVRNIRHLMWEYRIVVTELAANVNFLRELLEGCNCCASVATDEDVTVNDEVGGTWKEHPANI